MTDNPDETQVQVADEAPRPTRDAMSGRFLTGNPGGGRVKGSRNQITKLRLEMEEALRLNLRSHAEELLDVAIAQAKSGDHPAVMKALLDKILTTPKDDPDSDKKPEAVKVIVVTQPSAEPAKITVVKSKPPIDVTPTEVK